MTINKAAVEWYEWQKAGFKHKGSAPTLMPSFQTGTPTELSSFSAYGPTPPLWRHRGASAAGTQRR